MGRLNYWIPPRDRGATVMHNLGTLQFAFAFGIWSPWRGNLGEDFAIEALDTAGKVHRTQVRSAAESSRGSRVSLFSDEGLVLQAMPADPPIVLQLEQAVVEHGQLTINGWVVSRNKIRSVHVTIIGNEAVAAVFGQATPIPAEFGHYPNADTAGFTAQLRFNGTELPTQAAVIATSERNEEYHGVFPITPGDRMLTLVNNVQFATSGTVQLPRPAAAIQIEYPRLADGVVVLPERQPFRLAGWAVARGGIERLNVFVDRKLVGTANYGTPRRDVADVFPCWPEALHSGFSLFLQHTHFIRNPCGISLEMLLISGERIEGAFELRFGETPPAASDTLVEALLSDSEIWQFARTILMFGRDRGYEILSGMQTEALERGDVTRAIWAENVTKAFGILTEAWAGRPIDQRFTPYLRQHGYL